MLALAPRPTVVYLCVGATDIRNGLDGLMRLAAEQAARDVLQGGLFVFVNRRRDRVKLLASVKANQVEPFAYVRDLLTQLSRNTPPAVVTLLPGSWLAAHAESCRCWSR